MIKKNSNNVRWSFLGIIIFVIFIVHHQTLYNDFTNWDDPVQVYENSEIKQLSAENISSMFSGYYASMYQPLTTLMFAVEYQLFSLDPFWFHMTSLLLHLANTLLLFIIFQYFFRYRWQAFLTAILFGLHPLQVETVSWISARSTLLCFFFMFLSVLYYLKYHHEKDKKPSFSVLSVLFFLLSLFSKSASLFLPVLLLLIDYFKKEKIRWRNLANKTPYFVLALIFGLVTFFSRAETDMISKISTYYTFFDRIFIVAYSILLYLKNILFPVELSAYYAYPLKETGNLHWLYYVALPSVLALLVAAIIHYKNKKLMLGLSIFLLPVIPVLQFFPTLKFIAADRYVYFALTGVFFLIIHFIPALQKRKIKTATITMIVVYILFLGFRTQQQTQIWKNSETLWSDVLSKNSKIKEAWMLRAEYYENNNKTAKAVQDLNQLLKMYPLDQEALIYRSVLKKNLKDYAGAIRDCNSAIKLNDSAALAYSNRAYVYLRLEKFDQALSDANRALELDSTLPVAHYVKGRAIGTPDRLKEAIFYFSKAIELKPDYGAAYFVRGIARIYEEDTLRGCIDLHKAARFNHKPAEKYIKMYCGRK